MRTPLRSLLAAAAASAFSISAGSVQTVVNWTSGLTVPDNNPTGLADTRTPDVDASLVITGLEVRLKTSGGWNGDLYASLVHDSGFTVLLNRAGNSALNPAGSASSGFDVTFADSASIDIHTGIDSSGPITGTWQPDARTADPAVVTNLSERGAYLSSFNEAPVTGSWTLFLADNAAADTSTLVSWGLTITSESRAFAIWDGNGNASGIGGNGTWSSTGTTWATSNVGTSTAAQATTSQLVFDGSAGTVTVSGTVSPATGLRFKSTGYHLIGGTIELAGANPEANTLLIDTGVTATIGSTLTGVSGLTKSGEGTLVLAGANSHGGETIISGGTLEVNGDQSLATGAVTVSGSGTRFVGTGTIGGSTTINKGSIHSAGAVGATGSQSFASDLSYGSSSIFAWDIDTTTGASDSVSVSGALDVSSGATFMVVSTSAFTDAFWNTTRHWNVFGGDDFSAFALAYTANGMVREAGDFDLEGYFTFTNSGQTLTWTAVPEPSGAVAVLLLGAGLLRRRRIRVSR